MNSRANCKITLTKATTTKYSVMTVKKGKTAKPITNEMVGAVLQKLMAA